MSNTQEQYAYDEVTPADDTVTLDGHRQAVRSVTGRLNARSRGNTNDKRVPELSLSLRLLARGSDTQDVVRMVGRELEIGRVGACLDRTISKGEPRPKI